MRVCQPGPVAFQRANVLGGRRNEMETRALPVFGRPRGLSICFAAASPKSFGKTSRAGRARLNVSFLQAGFSRSVFSGLGLRFIPFHLAFVGFAQADDVYLACARSEHQCVQPLSDESRRLKPWFAVGFATVLDDERAGPLEFCRLLERDTTFSDVFLVLAGSWLMFT